MAARAGFIRSVEIAPGEDEIDRGAYPCNVPAVAALGDGVALDPESTIWLVRTASRRRSAPGREG